MCRVEGEGPSSFLLGDLKGDILFLEREFFLFRTGAKCSAAYMPRDATPIFFPEKENGRCDRPKERRLDWQSQA